MSSRPGRKYQVWTEEDIDRLKEYSKCITQKEAAKRLDRTCESLRKKSAALGIKWPCSWTREDEAKLYEYCVKMGQKEAAKLLGRTTISISQKSKSLGIKWRQGFWNLRKIANEVGCTVNTVKRLVNILYPDHKLFYTSGKRKFYMIEYEDAQRLIGILKRSRNHRKEKIRAGKIRWGKSYDIQ